MRTKRTMMFAMPAIALAGLAGCVRTGLTSQYAGWMLEGFRPIMVVVASPDLGFRQAVEAEFAKDSSFIASSSLFFVGRAYSDAEVARLLEARQVTGVLVMAPGDAGTTTSYMTTPTRSSGSATCNWSWNGSTMSCAGSSETRHGQTYAISKPWGTYQMTLYDRLSGNPVWVASGSANGNAFSSQAGIAQAAARKVIERLRDDGLIR